MTECKRNMMNNMPMIHIVHLNNRYQILRQKVYKLIIASILFYAFITNGTWSKSQSFTSARPRFEPPSSAWQAR